MNTPWVELRLRIGSAQAYNTGNEHGILTYIIPIAASTGQITETWVEVQSLTPSITASLHDSDGNDLVYPKTVPYFSHTFLESRASFAK